MEQLSHHKQQGPVHLLRNASTAIQTQDRIHCQSTGQSSGKSDALNEPFTGEFVGESGLGNLNSITVVYDFSKISVASFLAQTK